MGLANPSFLQPKGCAPMTNLFRAWHEQNAPTLPTSPATQKKRSTFSWIPETIKESRSTDGLRSSEAAIKKLDELQPSIVLADIYMPGKNGYEVCKYIRNHETLAEIPVVLLVGAFDAFDEQVAKDSGATANITKPFEPGALIDLVNSLLPPDESEPEPIPEPEPEPERAFEPPPRARIPVPGTSTRRSPARVAPGN